MLTVSKKQTHVKFFLWCDEVWQTFCGDSYYPTAHPNVCFYVRAITLKPLTVLFCHLLVSGLLLWVLLGFPIYYLGLSTFVHIIGAVIVGSAFIYSAILLDKKTKVFSRLVQPRIECMEHKGPKISSFFEVVYQWILDKHDKICSIMKVVD